VCCVISDLLFLVTKHETLWPLKNFKLYILCTLILFNPFHLIVGLRLIMIQNEFQNVVQIKIFFVCV
jgi:hypothetical protein